MTRRVWLALLGFGILMFAILYGGPRLSLALDRTYKSSIDKNATIVPGVVYLKKTHKGNTVHFRYHFRNKAYKNNEQSEMLYDVLEVGDSVQIKIDTLDPSKSYILSH